MSESFQALLSWAKDSSGSMKDMSTNFIDSFKNAKTPLDPLIDYHNFWSKTAGMESLVVDKNVDMSMDSFVKMVLEKMRNSMTEMFPKAMAAWREKSLFSAFSFKM
eukprot:GFUD01059321.1.p1 GENE.GFUD01059321.1~~GFUD01059321.1.p1  ORF type:complete len:114 (+),score=30.36 GFUD01059321.1:26-343(+)